MTETTTPRLRRMSADEVRRAARAPVDRETLLATAEIVDAVRDRGEAAVRELADRFGERAPGEPLVLGPAEMRAALDSIDRDNRAALERAADRIGAFARAQRDSIHELDTPIPGGRAGHTVEPIINAGCYAPGGRYPLPSSALMTSITARTAGCERVVVSSPGAHPATLAAAALGGADVFLAAGGAHGIAALAFGLPGLDPCDVIAGPGNRWVTAAKQLLVGVVGIDMLAGPSELLIIADDSADPGLVAADLLAQAEHDADAAPILVTTSPALADAVDTELADQLATLPTAGVARQAMANGFVCVVEDEAQAVAVSDRVAPEHLEILTRRPDETAALIRNAGALFVGANAAEVMGDYGAGPNHTLPTGGSARFQAGLSVSSFLRLRTWMRIDDAVAARGLIDDTRRIARMEGLLGHEASAARRATSS